MFGSKSITKIQSIILITIIVVAAVGVAAIVLWNGPSQSTAPIKIGLLADLDYFGKPFYREIILAAEQINAEGGILGRQVEVIGEDSVTETTPDTNEAITALNRLIAIDEVDFVIGAVDGEALFASQEIISQHKKIYISLEGTFDEYTQRVLDDYSKYKYYFSCNFNATSIYQGQTDSLLYFKEITGFNKIGYLAEDIPVFKGTLEGLDTFLPENGFDLVYKGIYPPNTVDLSSYFANAEASGVEILVPLIAVQGVPFVKEYYVRQSPLAIFGGMIVAVSGAESWERTDGKCNYVTTVMYPTVAGYQLTSKTLPFREAYFERWGKISGGAGRAYDILRFILPDAIERAGTIDTDVVIEALEETNVETCNARSFVFTESHGLMMGKDPNDPDEYNIFVMLFQWQNGESVPVYPKKVVDEAGASYIFPDWSGPWDNIS